MKRSRSKDFGGRVMCAPIGGRSGPVGAHPRKHGALLERWRAQCGITPFIIPETTMSRICCRNVVPQDILTASRAFPEPCGHVRPSPYQSLSLRRPMKGFASIPSISSVADVTPASCPVCQSSSIVTTAKSPDADSYWRCTSCGDIWNVSRSKAPRYGGHRWRDPYPSRP